VQDRCNHNKACCALANKLARIAYACLRDHTAYDEDQRLIYAMLIKGEEYTDRGQAYYEERYRQRVVANLNRRAQQLGLQVVPIAEPP
jgi:hypothetical protein